MPHPPQLFGSKKVRTQVPLQRTNGGLHCTMHLPNEHTWPVGQALPQKPQLFGSLKREVQLPLQLVNPRLHWQAELMHVPFDPQAPPHRPQFWGSVARSTH
jgi:hypothetical protein